MNMTKVPNDWWQAACERVREPLACVDLNNKFIWVNDAWCKMLGYAPNELIGKTWMEITKTEDVGGDLDAVAAVISGDREEYYLEKMYRRKDGAYMPVGLYVHRFPEVGEIICFIVDVKDLTKDTSIKELREEFGRLEQAVQEMQNVLENASIVKQIAGFLKKNWAIVSGLTVFFGTILKWIFDWIIHLNGNNGG